MIKNSLERISESTRISSLDLNNNDDIKSIYELILKIINLKNPDLIDEISLDIINSVESSLR